MLPHATLTNVMSKFLNIGMTLEQVIERTTVNAASAIRRTSWATSMKAPSPTSPC